MSISDLVFGALVIPSLIYYLVERLRSGKGAPMGESLRWGWRQWGKTLRYGIQMGVTILLWSLLLIIPGIVAWVKLIFTETIVAVEGDRAHDVLNRSKDLTSGHRWRIFFVLAVLGVVELAGDAGVLGILNAVGMRESRVLLAIGDSLMFVVDQWTTTAVLLIYLGVTRAKPSA
jgi:hypothetical protein